MTEGNGVRNFVRSQKNNPEKIKKGFTAKGDKMK